MRFSRFLLVLAIAALSSGGVLFAISSFREIHTSTHTFRQNGVAQAGTFGYGGETLTPSNPPVQNIIGTAGIADLIILTTPYQNFSSWVCHFVPPTDTYDRCVRFGGNYFNVTILYSYLSSHQSQIAYSQTLVDENITLESIPYHVASSTDVTVVVAYMGSGWVKEYSQTTMTNQTLSYPLIGYTEPSGTFWTLPNVSWVLMITGGGCLAISLLMSQSQSPFGPEPYRGPSLRACPACGRDNLVFAEKCQHCGRTLGRETREAATATH